MSDRKYRQQGYQDAGRERERGPSGDARPRKPREPYDPRVPRDPRVPNMPGFRQVFKCGRCGHVESMEIGPLSQCGSCGVPLRACLHCDSFDPGARFECRETIPARVSPKDTSNDCPLFGPRVQVERETGSAPASQTGRTSAAKKAFDDLFKI